MKAGFVYTSTTPELVQLLEDETKKQFGDSIQILTYTDPSILSETREHGYVTPKAAARLITMYLQAVQDGAQAVLNICSSVGEAADSAQSIAKYVGVPIIRIDEAMCRDALHLGRRICVLATLPTTLEPTKNTLRRLARELGRNDFVLIDGLVDAFGLNREQLQKVLISKALEAGSDADVILLCQGSMACCEQMIEQACGRPVVSSPRYGIAALKEALIEKGALQIN